MFSRVARFVLVSADDHTIVILAAATETHGEDLLVGGKEMVWVLF